MTATLYINQTLHGYADGHQLLASSLDLGREQQSLLLIMSDLSGPAFRNGYDCYLTGYSLAGGGYYCFARTWFAPEQARPGCVWTHTLLIRDEDIARIKDFRALTELFRRPTEENAFQVYEDRLVFEERDWSPYNALNDARGLLQALYGSPRRIVIPSDTAQKYEELILVLMNQQWPRLRRNFRFCTGALSLRESEFDLSVSPPEVTHSIGETGFVIDQGYLDDIPSEAWVEFANEDLAKGMASTTYRTFLWQFGPDYGDGRSMFRPLTEIFLILHSRSQQQIGDSLLSAVAHYFPKEQDARRLKTELFGREGRYNDTLGGEAAILRLLVSHPSAASITNDIGDIRIRARELTRNDSSAATEIACLSTQVDGDNSHLFLEEFFEHANWTDESLKEAASVLIPLILDHSPGLVGNAGLWARPDRLGVLSKLVSRIDNDEALLQNAIAAMIQSQAWDAVLGLVDQVGSAAVAAILSHVEASRLVPLDVPDAVLVMLGARPGLWTGLVDNGVVGPKCLRLLSAELDPRSRVVKRIDNSKWVAAAELQVSFVDSVRSLRSAVFFLSVGLSSWDSTGAVLAASGFSKVYIAAKNDALDSSIWHQLEPNLSWHNPSWDRCARLIKTVAEAYFERPWPLQLFGMTFQSAEELLRALDAIGQMWGGKRFVRHFKAAVLDGEIPSTPELKALFANL